MDIVDEARKIIGVCDDTKLFRWLGDAVTLIANKGDFEGWKGVVDICSVGCDCNTTHTVCCGKRLLTLPREVETVLAVNVGGHPTLGYGQLFNFHLNGPGDCRQGCTWSWQDQGGWHVTVKDIVTPTKLVAYTQTDEDNGKVLVVYGYDDSGSKLRRQEGGEWKDGYRVPLIYGYAIPDDQAPTVAKITGLFKDKTVGSVRLSSIDDSGNTGITLGIYEPDETLPQYRRIRLNRVCDWARVAYLKTNPVFSSLYDHIPLKSRLAFLLAVQARKHYSDLQVDQAHSFEADAARLELEAQQKAEPPTFSPIQVVDLNSVRDQTDYDIR